MRVLCVSPRFPPTNAADSHRLRLLLPHLAKLDCEVEVLAVCAADIASPQDPWLANQLPPDLPLHIVRAWQLSGWGLTGLAQRSFIPLYREGSALLASGRFDLVFFSTTEFLLHALGPLWRSRWGVPFCMDLQDPWVNDYYRRNPHVIPPGGRVKFALADRVHRWAEGPVVHRCSGFLSVSPDYLSTLAQRYGHQIARKPQLLAAFPAEPAEMGASQRPTSGESLPTSRTKTWRYIGRGGPDMARSARAFFCAWQSALRGGLLAPQTVRFEAIGTSYARAGCGEKTLEPLAGEAGLFAPQVSEETDRLPYGEMLQMLTASDALVVFGSDDPSYTASKIYPYLMAGKPLLAIFHERSSVVRLIREAGGGVCVSFNDLTTPEELAKKICIAWFSSRQCFYAVPLDLVAFEPYTAGAQAVQVAHWLKDVVAHAASRQETLT